MNLCSLQHVTPIKMEQNILTGSFVDDTSSDLSSTQHSLNASCCSFSDWKNTSIDVCNANNQSQITSTPSTDDQLNRKQSELSQNGFEIPKRALFSIKPHFVQDSANQAMGNEGIFDDILKTMSMNDLASLEPVFNYNDTNEQIPNSLNVFPDYHELVTGQQNIANNNSNTNNNNQQQQQQQQQQENNHGENSGASNNETNYTTIPTYDMAPQINSQNHVNMTNLAPSTTNNNHPHHTNTIQAQHLTVGYQSTSPQAGGDGSNSAHSSPFTPSPPGGGYDYPTSPHSKPSIPPNTDYPGDYNFNINFGEPTESAPKSAQYTYSHTLNKLFVKMNVTCPIRFKCDRFPQMNCIVRAIPVFKRPDHVTDVVTRCPNHKIPDEVNYNMQAGHLIRAEMPDERHVRYDVAADGRESVSVLHERPQVGAEYTTVLYKFMCLSSCVGGINRRPLLTVFTLETTEGVVLGRRVVEVRICSCPGRDRSQEEKRKRKDGPNFASNEKNGKRPFKNLQSTMDMSLLSKRKRLTAGGAGDQEEFNLKIVGREKYELLKRLKEALDLMELVSPQQREEYHNKEDQEQARSRQNSLENLQTNVGFVISPNVLSTATTSSTASLPASSKTNHSTITSTFTVSNPINCIFETPEFGSVPTHSSHPLTATPSGESSIGDCVDQSYLGSLQGPELNGGNWSPVGRDVPDTGKSVLAGFHNLQSTMNKSGGNNATWENLAENIKVEKREFSTEF